MWKGRNQENLPYTRALSTIGFTWPLSCRCLRTAPPARIKKKIKIKPSQTARMDSCSSNLLSRRQVRKERTNCKHRNNRHFTSSQTLNWCPKSSAILNREHASTALSGSMLGASVCSDWRVPGAGSCLIHIWMDRRLQKRCFLGSSLFHWAKF